MTMIFPGAMIVIVVFILAFSGGEGFWTNLIMFVNVLLAGLVATNYFEPAATWLTTQYNPLTMFADVLGFWGIFILTYAILMGAAGAVSKVKVKTISALDMALGYFFAVATGWILICLVCASIHFSPLGRVVLFGGFRVEDPSFFGTSPDRIWFAFNQKLSLGAFGRAPDPDDPERYVFDADGTLMFRYATRRETYEQTENLSGLEGLMTVPLGVEPTPP